MGSFVMPLLTLILTQKLGMSKSLSGSFISLLVLTQAPCLILGGKLADSVGRKKVIVGCGLAGAFLYILCGLLPQSHWMVAYIVLASDFYTMAFPAFNATLADLTEPKHRKSAFSLLYFGANIGMAISPILGGLLFRNHLHLLFLLDAATTVAYTIVIGVNVRETFQRTGEKAGTPGTAAKKQSVFRVLKAVPILAAFAFLLFPYDFCYSQWNFMLPAQFGDLFGGYGARMFSLLASANAFTVILLTPIITSLTRRLRPLIAISAGCFLFFIAYLGFGFGSGLPLFFLFTELFTFGEIMVTIQIDAFIANHTPPDCRGRVTAFSTFIRGSANSLGPLIMGHVLTVWDYRVSWLLIAFIVLAGGVGMFALNKKDRQQEPV